MIHLSKTTAFILFLSFAGLFANIYRGGYSERIINDNGTPFMPSQPLPGPPLSGHHILPFYKHGIPEKNVQIIKSLLGVQVTFFKGNINYAAQNLMQDPRYQALASNEKLVDAIRFQPFQSLPYLLLVAIAKTASGAPKGVPGKFNIVRETEKGGLLLKDESGRLYYYTGYLLATQQWKDMYPGQSLQDRFCKNLDQMAFCSTQNAVSINLAKPNNPDKDIPLLTLIR
jgi:hypothetical protein